MRRLCVHLIRVYSSISSEVIASHLRGEATLKGATRITIDKGSGSRRKRGGEACLGTFIPLFHSIESKHEFLVHHIHTVIRFSVY